MGGGRLAAASSKLGAGIAALPRALGMVRWRPASTRSSCCSASDYRNKLSNEGGCLK